MMPNQPLLSSQGLDSESGGPLQARGRRALRALSLRGGAEDAGGIIGFCLVVVFVLIANMVTPLQPNEYGLIRNKISGSIGRTVDRGGLHLTGPFKTYMTFPAVQMTLEFSKHSFDHPPVQTRTGADPRDPDSGGQPISISAAVQYKFVKETIRDVYLSFGSFEATKQRLLLLTGNMISNTAQEFTPQDFWTHRDDIAKRMFEQINNTIWDQAYVVAAGIQLMKVDFALKFEDSITQVQVAEQQQEINKYDQQVQQVVQSIEVLKSKNQAHIANISAAAVADAKEICAAAKRDAFNMKQGMKAKKYAELQKKLEFNNAHMAEYFKIKAYQGQEATGKVVVGLPGIDDAVAVDPKKKL